MYVRAFSFGVCALLSLSGCSGEEFEPSARPKIDSGGNDGGSIALGTEPLGATCGADSDCQTGHCADGVCCDRSCDGVCETCDAPGKLGSCEPFAAGTDPEAECLGASDPGGPCAGTCNGSSACSFPGSETSCGGGSCSAGAETAEVCDGDGACQTASADCGLFVCGGSRCKTSCTIDADCKAGAWCNSGLCETGKSNGASCSVANECTSGLCEQGSCCSTACAAPNACSSGDCLCNGTACSAGATCVTWYLDADSDGFGKSGPNDTLGCSNQAPPPLAGKPFSKLSTDCYDENKDAFPGQTKFFTKHRGDQSFDYDCSGTLSYEIAVSPSVACKDCGNPGPLGCQACNVSPLAMGLECNSGWGGCTGVKVKEAFQSFTACGQVGAFRYCQGSCQSIPGGYNRPQGCR